MDGLIFLLTKSTTNLGKDVNLPWYYCTTEYVRNYTWPWETQLGCSCYWRLKMLTSLSFNFIWHFYDVSTQIWLDKSAHKQIYLMKESLDSLEMSCCWHLESRPNSFCTWASRVKTNWWVSWLQSYNISVVVNTYILYKEHTWRRIEHTHTSLNVKYWCLFVGTFILQSSVFSHWSYSTVPNDKRRKKKIPVTHRPWTQIQICNFKAEVNGSKVKLSNSEFVWLFFRDGSCLFFF